MPGSGVQEADDGVGKRGGGFDGGVAALAGEGVKLGELLLVWLGLAERAVGIYLVAGVADEDAAAGVPVFCRAFVERCCDRRYPFLVQVRKLDGLGDLVVPVFAHEGFFLERLRIFTVVSVAKMVEHAPI